MWRNEKMINTLVRTIYIAIMALWFLTACSLETSPDHAQSELESGDNVSTSPGRDNEDEPEPDSQITKTDTILIEGTEEEHKFQLYYVPSLGFSTYVIDDMSVETVNSDEGTAFVAVANFADEVNEEATVEIIEPGDVNTVDEAVFFAQEKAENGGYQLVGMEQPDTDVIVEGTKKQFDIQDEGLAGSVTVVERGTRVYIVTVRYPLEFGDGFGPRSSQLLMDLVWHDTEENAATPDSADGVLVRRLVEKFGEQLQHVSLSAPEEVVSEAIETHYGKLISSDLLAEWQRDPRNAPGRLTSSPWPERIDIQLIERQTNTSYEVRGKVIEITGVEQISGGAAAKRPITLVVTKAHEQWLIDSVVLDMGTQTQGNSRGKTIVYTNDEYGFCFSLPKSWNGYTVVKEEWEGLSIEGPQAGEVVETGQILLIRHPQWTAENPRQDIPIMVFTVEQWDALHDAAFSVGAAPIPPSELGQNEAYVFALPARYNYAFPTGFQEVQEIIEGGSLDPRCRLMDSLT